MKKTFLSIALFLSVSPAFALDNLCITKQKNAASFKVAQELGVAVQGVEVTGFEYGVWTEAVGNNTGSDKVTVRVGNRLNRGMTIKSYEVAAKQVGATDDCNILSISEARN